MSSLLLCISLVTYVSGGIPLFCLMLKNPSHSTTIEAVDIYGVFTALVSHIFLATEPSRQ